MFLVCEIYVDLAVFIPFGDRMAKKVKLLGSTIGPDGKLSPVELYGPPNIFEWRKAYRIFATCCLLFNVISKERLERYADLVEKYANQYGPSMWALVYQTDVRTRLEHSVRIRREGVLAAAKATKDGTTHDFDAERPWEWVWAQLCGKEEAEWWREELVDKAQLVSSGAAHVSTYVEGDAPVRQDPLPYHPAASPVLPDAGRPLKRAAEPAPPAPAPPAQYEPVASPMLHVNRSGAPLCKGFQVGACSKTDGMSRCSRDGVSVHQCARCLDNRHGCHFPRECTGVVRKEAPVKKKQRGGGRKP